MIRLPDDLTPSSLADWLEVSLLGQIEEPHTISDAEIAGVLRRADADVETEFSPLLKNEWVGSGESVLWARSRAGEARRSEPLTAITGPDNRALLNAGMVRHSATEARAR